ncbi:hypothetical protein TrispH2_009853 [Trichoplax sp. H2]|nr:hypothetical protein TrispH2_009853 [Trichoplax sp. H2]|eukprot:RDD38224.1 hypothetical protein TrispH2_009853 [Trichoplax sp. H2]
MEVQQVEQPQLENELTTEFDQDRSSPVDLEDDSVSLSNDRICYNRESLLEVREKNLNDKPSSLVLLNNDADCLIKNYSRKNTLEDTFDFTPSYLKSEKSLAREKEGLLLGPQNRSFNNSFQNAAPPVENRDNTQSQPTKGKPSRPFRRLKRPQDLGNDNYNGQRNHSYRNQGQEDAPEWMTFGPSSRMETIELHGFDKQKEKVEIPQSQDPAINDNKPVKLENFEEKSNQDAQDNNDQLNFDLDRFLTMDEPDLILSPDTTISNRESGSSRFSKLVMMSFNSYIFSARFEEDELDIIIPDSLAEIIATPDGSPRYRQNPGSETNPIEQQQNTNNKGSAFDKLVASMRAAGRLPANERKAANQNVSLPIAPAQFPDSTTNKGEMKEQQNVNVARKLDFNEGLHRPTEHGIPTQDSDTAIIISPAVPGVKQPTSRATMPKVLNAVNYSNTMPIPGNKIMGSPHELRGLISTISPMPTDNAVNVHNSPIPNIPESITKKTPVVTPAFMPTSVLKKLHVTKRMNKPTMKEDSVDEKLSEKSKEEIHIGDSKLDEKSKEEVKLVGSNVIEGDPKPASSFQVHNEMYMNTHLAQVMRDSVEIKPRSVRRDDLQARRVMESMANASVKHDHMHHPRVPQQMMPLSPYPVVIPGGPRSFLGRPPLPFPDAYRPPGMYPPMGYYRVAPPNIVRSPMQNMLPQNFNKNRENNSFSGDIIRQPPPIRAENMEERQAQQSPNNPLSKWFSKDVLSSSSASNRVQKDCAEAMSLADIEKDC